MTIAQLHVLDDVISRAYNIEDGYSLSQQIYKEAEKGEPFGKWQYILYKDGNMRATIEIEDCDFPSINVRTIGNPFFNEN